MQELGDGWESGPPLSAAGQSAWTAAGIQGGKGEEQTARAMFLARYRHFNSAEMLRAEHMEALGNSEGNVEDKQPPHLAPPLPSDPGGVIPSNILRVRGLPDSLRHLEDPCDRCCTAPQGGSQVEVGKAVASGHALERLMLAYLVEYCSASPEEGRRISARASVELLPEDPSGYFRSPDATSLRSTMSTTGGAQAQGQRPTASDDVGGGDDWEGTRQCKYSMPGCAELRVVMPSRKLGN
jgi:hypothetical protein